MNALGKVKIELTLLSERNNVQIVFVLFVIILRKDSHLQHVTTPIFILVDLLDKLISR